MVTDYYSQRLAAGRLRRCYEIAPPRVRQYLDAEVAHVCEQLHPGDSVLELGCGYGRVAWALARVARSVVGIDTAIESLSLARHGGLPANRCAFAGMDAARLGFVAGSFDAVVCVQNGIAVFDADPARVFAEALRVVRPGGVVLFSTYDERFWPARLAWFEAQAAAGLVGEIDREQTRDGTIVCKDGFRAAALKPAALAQLARGTGAEPRITFVDDSSVFCSLWAPAPRS